jgi:SAM-dependent methyltransferase
MTRPHVSTLPPWWDGGASGALARGAARSEARTRAVPARSAGLERIIAASSNEGDVVLDPFCGCGTTIAAAQALNRRWMGIDVTYLAIDLIRNRLRGLYGDDIEATYHVDGIPADEDSARALFAASPFDFERWAVSLVDGTPNEKQVGDRGIDGVVPFPLDAKGGVGRALVSVKGGKMLNPGMVRDLIGTVQAQRAEMGLLLTLERPTRGMKEAARHSGPLAGQSTASHTHWCSS